MRFVLYMQRSAEILILNKEGITEKKIPMSVAPMSRYRRKEPILCYVPKNDKKKKEFMHLRVNYVSRNTLHLLLQGLVHRLAHIQMLCLLFLT